MSRVLRSGVIPFYIDNQGEIQMYFMKPSDPKFGGPDFQVAKGQVDEGESIFDAGLREAAEELGLKTENITDVLHLGHYLHTITVYIAAIVDPSDFDMPDRETGATVWFTLDEFLAEGRELHADIIRDAHEKITKIYT